MDVDSAQVLDVFDEVASAIAGVLTEVDDWGTSGRRDGQYHADLLVDAVALPILRSAGFGILSEESGSERLDAPVVVCIDPLDGSTNASRGIPHFATSLCAVDRDGLWVALVVHQARANRWWAVRGEGAFGIEGRLERTSAPEWSQAIVAISGPAPLDPGWGQFRSFGASAIDMCLVADSTVDAFIDMSPSAHGVWDYAAATLICHEAGVEVRDAQGRDLIVLNHGARRTPMAAPVGLMEQAFRVRSCVA